MVAAYRSEADRQDKAGVAAVLALRNRCSFANVSVSELQAERIAGDSAGGVTCASVAWRSVLQINLKEIPPDILLSVPRARTLA